MSTPVAGEKRKHGRNREEKPTGAEPALQRTPSGGRLFVPNPVFARKRSAEMPQPSGDQAEAREATPHPSKTRSIQLTDSLEDRKRTRHHSSQTRQSPKAEQHQGRGLHSSSSRTKNRQHRERESKQETGSSSNVNRTGVQPSHPGTPHPKTERRGLTQNLESDGHSSSGLRRAVGTTSMALSSASASTNSRTPSRTIRRESRIAANVDPDAMKVFCRIRPLTREELRRNESRCIRGVDSSALAKAPPSSATFRRGEAEMQFSYDGVFSEWAGQSEVFDRVAVPIVENALKANKCGLIFAYGITNAGKTHTVTGAGPDGSQDAGILPRTVDIIFNSICDAHLRKETTTNESKERSPKRRRASDVGGLIFSDDEELLEAERRPTKSDSRFQHTFIELDSSFDYYLQMSYIEIYNERVFDLLSSGTPERRLRQDASGNVFVQDLSYREVNNCADGYDVLREGHHNRRNSDNAINRESSRSHAVITFTLLAADGADVINTTRLSVVDLAGSEQNSRTKSAHQTAVFREAAQINQSLTTFRRCIEILRQNSQSGTTSRASHVPYRDSVLTRLFQEFFTMSGRAAMVINVSPASQDFDETVAAMRFSATAREVTVQSSTPSHRGYGVERNGSIPLPGALRLAQEARSKRKQDALAAQKAIETWDDVEANKLQTSTKIAPEFEEPAKPTREAPRLPSTSPPRRALLEEKIRALENEHRIQVQKQVALERRKWQKMIDGMTLKQKEAVDNAQAETRRSRKENQRLREMLDAQGPAEISHAKEIQGLRQMITELEASVASSRCEQQVEIQHWQESATRAERRFAEATLLQERTAEEADRLSEENSVLKRRVAELVGELEAAREALGREAEAAQPGKKHKKVARGKSDGGHAQPAGSKSRHKTPTKGELLAMLSGGSHKNSASPAIEDRAVRGGNEMYHGYDVQTRGRSKSVDLSTIGYAGGAPFSNSFVSAGVVDGSSFIQSGRDSFGADGGFEEVPLHGAVGSPVDRLFWPGMHEEAQPHQPRRAIINDDSNWEVMTRRPSAPVDDQAFAAESDHSGDFVEVSLTIGDDDDAKKKSRGLRGLLTASRSDSTTTDGQSKRKRDEKERQKLEKKEAKLRKKEAKQAKKLQHKAVEHAIDEYELESEGAPYSNCSNAGGPNSSNLRGLFGLGNKNHTSVASAPTENLENIGAIPPYKGSNIGVEPAQFAPARRFGGATAAISGGVTDRVAGRLRDIQAPMALSPQPAFFRR